MVLSDSRKELAIQTARIAEEIDRTRQICIRTLELLKLSVPDTFLGRKMQDPND